MAAPSTKLLVTVVARDIAAFLGRLPLVGRENVITPPITHRCPGAIIALPARRRATAVRRPGERRKAGR
jgi:hypothetical protein